MSKTHINVRLREGVDSELKEWYESLPNGDKSYIIRRILRKHLEKKKQ